MHGREKCKRGWKKKNNNNNVNLHIKKIDPQNERWKERQTDRDRERKKERMRDRQIVGKKVEKQRTRSDKSSRKEMISSISKIIRRIIFNGAFIFILTARLAWKCFHRYRLLSITHPPFHFHSVHFMISFDLFVCFDFDNFYGVQVRFRSSSRFPFFFHFFFLSLYILWIVLWASKRTNVCTS